MQTDKIIGGGTQYYPCTTCAGILYAIEPIDKLVLCCQNCACVDYNVVAMTDAQPQSERSMEIHSLAALSVAARNLMNGLLTEVDETSLNNLRAQVEAAYKTAKAPARNR